MSDKADGRFRAIFEHSHDAILLADDDGRIIDAFASHLAHEVRSPLTTVSMVLGWLQRRYAGVVQNEDLEYVRRAEKAV